VQRSLMFAVNSRVMSFTEMGVGKFKLPLVSAKVNAFYFNKIEFTILREDMTNTRN